jgi:hypothetical protein
MALEFKDYIMAFPTIDMVFQVSYFRIHAVHFNSDLYATKAHLGTHPEGVALSPPDGFRGPPRIS